MSAAVASAPQQQPPFDQRRKRPSRAVARNRRAERENAELRAIEPKSLVGRLVKSKDLTDLDRVFMDSLKIRVM